MAKTTKKPSAKKFKIKIQSDVQKLPDRKLDLNPAQEQAITHKHGPILVIAGAGTGKTRVITERIAYVLNSGWCKNSELLALTFTEKATAELEERVDRLMPLGYEAIPIHTFHGFCDRILREFGVDIGLDPAFRILAGVEQWMFLKEHLFEFELDYYRPLGNPTAFIDALLSAFSRFKEELDSPEKVIEVAQQKTKSAKTEEESLEAKRILELGKAYQKYQALLTQAGFLDYADLHTKVIELFRLRPNILKHLQSRYQYILVDEYQDTNIAQNTMVDQLAALHKNLMVVGDDDQSIYKFRGAAISNILQFEEKYPEAKHVVLTQNYRSSQAILDLAYASIQYNNPDRLEVKAGVDKKLKGQRPGSADLIKLVHFPRLDEEMDFVMEQIQYLHEGRGVPLPEIAILCRTNAQLLPFSEELKKRNIPYEFVSEKGLYQKEEILDLVAFLRILANPMDDISFYRVMCMPVWGVPMETVMFCLARARQNHQSVWSEIKKNEATRFLRDTIVDCLEFSRTHTAGETLHRFGQSIKLYEQLLAQGTIEAEEKIMSIAAFFNKIREFERLSSRRSVVDFVNYLDLAQEAGENPSARFEPAEREGVFVSTVHGAKGLEFEAVFIASLTNDRFPNPHRRDAIAIPDELVHEILTESDEHLEEERRLFYVAVTRAKEYLYLLHSDFYLPTGQAGGTSTALNPRKKKRSRFIDEIIDQVPMTQLEKTPTGIEEVLKPQETFIIPEGSRPKSHPRITQFSYSQLLQFKTCPRQYEYANIYKIPEPLSANLSFGITMHSTLQAFYKTVEQQKQASLFTEFQPDLSLEHLLQVYDEKWVDQGYETRAHMELRRARGKEILTAFYEHFKEDIPRIRFLEKGFKLRVGEYTLSGRLDRADDLPDGTLEIIDYKTGRSKSEKEVAEDLQLFIYALAAQECFNLPASRLTLYFLDDDTRVTVEPNLEKMEAVKTEIRKIADEINRSDFAPTPSQHKCQYCPFSKICDASMA